VHPNDSAFAFVARLARLTLPAYPHHIIQRGNNRQPIFTCEADYIFLLDLLFEYTCQFEVALHAYVLMGNHFHLLATPKTSQGLPQMMQAVGRRYVRYFNHLYQRSGTLWEGRYKSTLIDSEQYLLVCMAYCDLNPVRASLVANAADYRWSSYLHYSGAKVDRLITPHALFWELGNTPFAREAAYAQVVQAGISTEQQKQLTESALHGWALGADDFLESLQKKTARRVAKASAGRPRLNKI
jgi:putative transposase